MGPAASQLSIKLLGTNGGGFLDVYKRQVFKSRPRPEISGVYRVLILSEQSAMNTDVLQKRIRLPELREKVTSPEAAAEYIKDGMKVRCV